MKFQDILKIQNMLGPEAQILLKIFPEDREDEDGAYEGMDAPLQPQLDYAAQSWLKNLLESVADSSAAGSSQLLKEEQLIFILDIEPHFKKRLLLRTKICKRRKQGGLGKPYDFYPSTTIKKDRITDEDLKLFSWIKMVSESEDSNATFYFYDRNIQPLLEKIIETGRCYWQKVGETPLTMGDTRKTSFSWKVTETSDQMIHSELQTDTCFLLPTVPMWYVDAASHQAGKISADIPDATAFHLLNAPKLSPVAAKKIQEALQTKHGAFPALPMPRAFQRTQKEAIRPTPCLHLFCKSLTKYRRQFYMNESVPLALAKISFRYDTHQVPWHKKDPVLQVLKEDTLITVQRDFKLENAYVQVLRKYSVPRLSELQKTYFMGYNEAAADLSHSFFIGEVADSDPVRNFTQHAVPELRKAGWDITFSDDYLFPEAIEVDEWYSDLQETSEYDWFNLELGVILDGERISLLAPLLEMIKRHDAKIFLKELETETDQKLTLEVAKGKWLSMSYARIFPIVRLLVELYSPKESSQTHTLKISRLRAALLAEMEKAFKANQLRWFGADKVLDLGRRLQNFSGIEAVPPPAVFHATLRPYQQEGLNWLQFLREYHLNGILADDMGLGKTVQTLAHLAIEKQAGRLTKPCAIIAPTSVIINWKIEAERFSPTLKVLFMQGLQRKARFSEMDSHDLILTTYPLLIRDAEILIKQDFYFIILDEAHYIKNAQAKMTQIAHQLKSDYRLCLTGTPLENHLGELWSLYHFLMPGLLGTSKEFRQRYRIPIEKHTDTACQSRLTQTVKPFMLRRTKKEVAQDLPEKTEMLHTVELDPKQQDLYESIRLAMHDKVKKAIDEKGIERSQIIILDALLKLRQVCCDPRLLKLKSARQATSSAKLTALMELLPTMLAEGRRILLFSQFTEMLSLIEQELTSLKIDYLKLTGQTQDRLSLIKRFQNEEVPLFLISLRAGGTGLNLTAADTVIHYDPWWNPSVENQATDRAHRIGQDKAVFVYKLITTGTVEERILDMQRKKRALAESILTGDGGRAAITRRDFEVLFS